MILGNPVQITKLLFVLIISVFLFIPNSIAAQPSKVSKSSIIIKGNERVDDKSIESYLHPGLKAANKSAINESLKKLYESDLFSEVKIYQQNNKVVIEVKENPIISNIKFEGNKKIEDEMLTSEIKLKKRSIYTKSALQSDVKRINDIYIKSGRFLAKIEPQIVQKDQNRVDLVFKIDEGKKAAIEDIKFVGNNVFTNKQLTDEITTRKSRWFRFLSSSDVYDSDRIQFDRERLRRFYNSEGYADFSVISSIAQIAPTKDKFFITFLLDEGIRYHLGKVTITNKVKKFDESVLKDAIETKSGKVYDGDLVDKTIDNIIKIMSDQGYAFAYIEPILKRDKENKIIDVEYLIKETPRIYINQIHIFGNTRTLDEVIRRELRIREGDPYNINKVNRSRQRIQNLGFFDKVEMNTKRIGTSDKVDIEIEVKEKKTGELSFGVGYSTVEKETASIGIKEINLMGTGQELSLNLQKSKYRATNEISFTEPYFMGRELAAGFNLTNYKSDKINTLVYSQKANSIGVHGDYSITEHLGHQLRYSFSDEKIDNIDPSAAITIQNLRGRYTTSSIGQSLMVDERDNRQDPRDGYYATVSQDYAGPGGTVHYLKHEGSAAYYIPIVTNDFVLKFAGRVGYIKGVGQDVKSNNNFFLGGDNFRGFEYAGMGPRTAVNGDAKGGDAVGGKLYYVGTSEFRFPLGLPKEFGISSALFSDVGSLRMVDKFNKTGTEVIDTGALRASYGISIIWNSPIAPIRLDFSKVAKAEVFDRKEFFRFSFVAAF